MIFKSKVLNTHTHIQIYIYRHQMQIHIHVNMHSIMIQLQILIIKLTGKHQKRVLLTISQIHNILDYLTKIFM